jgi:ribosomal protein S27AE
MLIYKISSPNTDLVYVGKTNQTLGRRFSCHLSNDKRFLAGKMKTRCTSYKVLEHGGAIIELIEESDDEDYWINAIPNTCNEKRGLFDQAAYLRAYYAENKDALAAYDRAYYEENREEICAKSKAYREENREEIRAKKRQKEPCPNCGRVVTHSNMAKHQRTKVCQNHGL